ncbi:transcriptional regulator [Bradyrhizobium sp. Leo170]|uniref:helix-turn-helix domain-containing protein n=1 Tax=Bradyrhizobium sp. Leo170 TaxID=1571199 RepID=UPI00102E53C7|nr:transcriptional regulator [Bradyrhizobium sp. Leo170]TAI60319.1 transcriptional regulator [Bradyrhizobium sp. Leo170]
MKITGAQIRAARGFLHWSVAKLAERANVGISTIQKIEDVDGDAAIESNQAWRSEARADALRKIVATLEAAGITFLPANAQGNGIRRRSD